MSWPQVELSEVAEINPRYRVPDDVDLEGLVSFVPMAAVSEETYSIEDEQERPLGEVKKGFTPFKNDDVIVAKITPCFENGKVAQVDIKHEIGFGSTEFHVLRSDTSQLDPRYLYHFVRRDKIRFIGEKRMTGSAGQKRVPKVFWERLEIPLPPLQEQQRIAAILDKADALRAQRRAALAKLDTLLQATFLDMFGDPVTNPMGWEEYELGNLLCTIIDYRGKTPPKSPSGIPLISAANVKNGKVDISKPQYISEETYAEWTTRGFTQPGDVLITTEAPVGAVAAYPEDGVYQISRRVMALRPNEDLVLPHYLLEVMLHPNWHNRLKSVTRGSTVPRVLKPDITTQPVPVPPKNLQSEFVKQVEALNDIHDNNEVSLDQLDDLFHSLQQRAFEGEL